MTSVEILRDGEPISVVDGEGVLQLESGAFVRHVIGPEGAFLGKIHSMRAIAAYLPAENEVVAGDSETALASKCRTPLNHAYSARWSGSC
jgi:hypothetical protein